MIVFFPKNMALPKDESLVVFLTALPPFAGNPFSV